MPPAPDPDARLMAMALGLARAQLGRVAPNPAVGCVLARNGRVIAAGATGDGGRPHAEEQALRRAGDAARDAVAYVTLEPCSARTAGGLSCAQLLAEAGVRRVVVACEEPNPKAAHGVSRLAGAGVEVRLGVLREEALALNAGFFQRLQTGRPRLTITASAQGQDAEFDLQRGESFEAALDRLGAAGATRVYVLAGTALAAQLKARGLVDADETA